MTTLLTRHGDELALVIEQQILDLLKIDASTPLEIRMNGRELIVTPASSPNEAALDAAWRKPITSTATF